VLRPLIEKYRRSYSVLVFLIYLVSSLYVFTMWTLSTESDTALNGFSKAKVSDVIYGKAHKPFVFRALIPIMVRASEAAIPEATGNQIEKVLINRIPQVKGIVSTLGWEADFLLEYVIALTMAYAFLLGFLFALRNLFKALYHAPWPVIDFVPLLALLVLPVFFKTGTHFLYDFPTLFFFTFLLLLLYRRKWRVFYPILVLATINKETTILIPLVMFVYYRNRMERHALLRHIAIQIVLITAIKCGLAVMCWNNPGDSVEIHLWYNMQKYLVPCDIKCMICNVVVFVSIFYRFTTKHLYLRCASIIMIPLLFFYFVSGMRGEIRVFYEAYPVLLLLGFHTLADLVGCEVKVLREG